MLDCFFSSYWTIAPRAAGSGAAAGFFCAMAGTAPDASMAAATAISRRRVRGLIPV